MELGGQGHIDRLSEGFRRLKRREQALRRREHFFGVLRGCHEGKGAQIVFLSNSGRSFAHYLIQLKENHG